MLLLFGCHWLKNDSFLAHIQCSKLWQGQIEIWLKVCRLPEEGACCLQNTTSDMKQAVLELVLSINNFKCAEQTSLASS